MHTNTMYAVCCFEAGVVLPAVKALCAFPELQAVYVASASTVAIDIAMAVCCCSD